MKAFEALAEHLQLAQKAQLLKLDVAEQSVGLGEMQDIEQQCPVDRDLVGLRMLLTLLDKGSGAAL